MSAASPGGLVADKASVDAYIRALFAYADEGSFASLRGFFDLRTGTFKIRPVQIGSDLDNLVAEATRFATECAGWEEPIVCAPPVATFNNSRQAREADLQNGLALSVECDATPAAARDKLERLLGRATLVVASGGQWTDPETGQLQPKLHLHWRLNEPTRDAEGHRQLKLARTLATKIVGGDPTNQPMVHPIRCAGSWHRKAAPRPATIISHTDSELDLAEALELLKQAGAATGGNIPQDAGAGRLHGTGEERETAQLVSTVLAAQDYHAPLAALAMRMLKGGTTDAQAVELLRGIMAAVPTDIRDTKDGTVQPGRWQARFEDIPRAVRTARAKIGEVKTESPKQSKLKLLSTADCIAAKPRHYVVKGIIAAGDVALMIGAPGTGKSALAPLMSYAVALGQATFGRRVRPGKVLYVAAEDAYGMPGRIHALKLRHGDAADFFLVEGATDLFAAGGQADELLTLVEHEKPAVVVIDTIAAAFCGMRENESDDMGRVIKLARDLARGEGDKPGPAVILLHHVPKGDATTPRGHGNLAGDADVILRLSKNAETGIVNVTFGKNRNGPSYGVELAFSIESVLIGQDEDCDDITAPVAVECVAVTERERLKPTERVARTFLADLLVTEGKLLPSGTSLPPDLYGVRELAWRQACDDRRLSACEDKKDRTKVFNRAFTGLRTKGVVAANAGWVWLTHPERGIGDHS